MRQAAGVENNPTSHEIVFEEPPRAARGGGSKYRQLLSQVANSAAGSHGRWARIMTSQTRKQTDTTRSYLQTQARRQNTNVIPGTFGRWEFVSRTLEDGRGGLYVRYNGQ